MNETAIKISVLKMIKKHYPNAFVYKTADRYTAGIPDLIICNEGRFYGIELKIPGKDAKPIQKIMLDKIFAAGGTSAVCHSAADVRDVLSGERNEN